MSRALDVLSAARYVCERTGWRVSNLELQKLLYLAHMIYMGRTGQRLIDETFEAWDFGPVSPRLYRQVKIFGAEPVRDVFHGARPIPEGEAKGYLDSACDYLSSKTPGTLVAMTHWKHGAWAKNYRPGSLHVPIPDSDIIQEYKKRAAQ